MPLPKHEARDTASDLDSCFEKGYRRYCRNAARRPAVPPAPGCCRKSTSLNAASKHELRNQLSQKRLQSSCNTTTATHGPYPAHHDNPAPNRTLSRERYRKGHRINRTHSPPAMLSSELDTPLLVLPQESDEISGVLNPVRHKSGYRAKRFRDPAGTQIRATPYCASYRPVAGKRKKKIKEKGPAGLQAFQAVGARAEAVARLDLRGG